MTSTSAHTPASSTAAAVARGRPFEKGNAGGPGNPFAAQVARIRSQLYAAATPKRIAKLIEINWLKALGEWEVEEERPMINPKTGRRYRDGRTHIVMVKEPPSKPHQDWLGERLFAKMPIGFYPSDDAGVPVSDEEKLGRFVEILRAAGLEDRIPHRLRIASTQEQAPSVPPTPTKAARARRAAKP